MSGRRGKRDGRRAGPLLGRRIQGESMIVFSNALGATATILGSLLNIYFWIVIISAVLSWVKPDPYNPIVRTLRALTEPVFYRVRKWLPFTYMSGLDFSPLVVLLTIELVNNIVIASMRQYALTLR
jgi:YggT family protein